MHSRNETTDKKNALLSKWLNRKKVTGGANSGISRMPEGTLAPLSLGQQRLWFLQQLFPGNPFYHYADVYRLRGGLQQALLFHAFELVAQNHAVLRTTFLVKEGQLVQMINPQPLFDITNHDLSNLPEAQREEAAQNLSYAAARRPFNLSEGPLTRITLIRMTGKEHLLVLTMHHIITDKWSNRILRDELAANYNALCVGDKMPERKLPVQYADYAYWQQSQQPDQQHLDYWKVKLAGELPVLELPGDHSRPVRPAYEGAFYEQELPPTLFRELKAISQRANTTMFVLMLAAFKVLLYRYSGQRDILVGTPVTNRDKVELEKLIGFFNDTLVLRSDLSVDLSFLEFVEQVRQTSLEAFSHKNTPFETIVRTLKPERYMSTNPLFQVMFLYHQVPETPSFGPGLTLEHEPFDFGVSKFDLTLYVSEADDRLTTIFEYASDLFDRATVERMQGHLRTMLEAIVENPDTQISSLPLLTQTERRQLLLDWNATKAPVPDVKCIHHFIEKQATQQPDHPAVKCQGKRLTYQALNDKANAVARQLLALGIKPNTPVGLFADRSLDMIAGLLGILKAGAAYLPLDPDYPPERIDFMVQDAGVPVILLQARYEGLFRNTAAQQLVIDKMNASPEAMPTVEVSSGDLAYVIYTSGSTGRPKGVPVTHANLVHSTVARFSWYPEQPGSFLLLSSFAFDSSMAGIFWTLCSGGTLILPEKRIEQDMHRLAALISEREVTHTLLLPSLYKLLLQHAPAGQLTSLKVVMVAGEACSASMVRLHFNHLPEVFLYNEYGPTEATVWCIAHQIRPEDGEGQVPIGHPIPNMKAYILDKNLELVPIGVAGELYIGGTGVTQGYLNRPELTASRFLKNPYSNDSADRLYKTGDLARYRPDGVIEFLGRADHQVKIRGYRIELDEIKEVMLQYPAVQEAVVLVQQEQVAGEIAIGKDETERIAVVLEKLDREEAERLLASIEALSDNELDYLLAEMKKTNTPPLA